MNSRKKPQDQNGAEPLNPAAPSPGPTDQWIWPVIAVVVVIGGMALGYALFT
ncbi:hypothetical protein [Nocardiopsis quinghaiensis]|uniref:hypothetical protein n=1 Tax=Nocardiopsis quinghaiensis TaxID=464995 RepID=UPI0016819A4B|nr:hypothetical protein [Nocardiopsis quinghaiensis]